MPTVRGRRPTGNPGSATYNNRLQRYLRVNRDIDQDVKAYFPGSPSVED